MLLKPPLSRRYSQSDKESGRHDPLLTIVQGAWHYAHDLRKEVAGPRSKKLLCDLLPLKINVVVMIKL
jgi:hypothetical protein